MTSGKYFTVSPGEYTKTEDGKRIIALDDDTINILTIWRNRQLEIGLGNSNDFMFSYDGLPMIKSTIGRIIKRYSQFAGVTRIQAKGLRHSHASYLINEFNVSVLVLSQRMGPFKSRDYFKTLCPFVEWGRYCTS